MAIGGYCFNAYDVIPKKKKKREESSRTESTSSTYSSTSSAASSNARNPGLTTEGSAGKHWYGSEPPKRRQCSSTGPTNHQWGPRT